MTFFKRMSASTSALNTVFLKCAALCAVATLTIVLLMLLRFSAEASAIVTDRLRDLSQNTAVATAERLDDAVRFNVSGKVHEAIDATFKETGENGIGLLVIGRDSAVLAQTGTEAAEDISKMIAAAQQALSTGQMVNLLDGFLVGVPVRTKDAGEIVGALTLWLNPAPSLAHIQERRLQVGIEAAIAFVAILAGFSLLIRRIVARPLVQLSGAIEQVRKGDFDIDTRLSARGDEIGVIAQSLVHLSDALEKARAIEMAAQTEAEEQARVVDLLQKGLKSLSAGNLTVTIDADLGEAYDGLRMDFNAALRTLRQAITEVRTNAESIRGGAEEISRASDDLSLRTESQAATLEETSAALDQLAASVKSAAEGAQEVSNTVHETNRMATDNGQVMQTAISAMAEIEKSSDKIGEIIGVIDDIAFQTNLLALNAGVEAARAGAAGKGFAIVASEVRALAQRSSDAAKQIKLLISGSSQQVKAGAKLVDQAGEALMSVVNSVDHISELISGIATGAGEQAIGVNEINQGVTNLDQVTQQNAAMVEESTAAAHMLKSDAMNLSGLVAKFDIAMNDTVAPVPMDPATFSQVAPTAA